MHSFDAVVIGGGPAGSTAALLLARAGWSVALVERVPFPRRKVCGEFLSATNLPLLAELGVAAAFTELAGPEVRRVGLFARDRAIAADMPRLGRERYGWGRALSREHLDTLLLERAAAEGVHVWQPWSVVQVRPDACTMVSVKTRDTAELRARVMIAAHGSWEPGQLPTQPARGRPRASDLFGFKAHFLNCRLPAGLMPLLTFPGGYGGMVHTDHGRVSLSCCVRRDTLERCREAGKPAGACVLQYITAASEPLRHVLDRAVLEDRWRSAGPIRPGIRSRTRGGMFLVGNAAGEAHPAIAEGISMAMQSGWLLARHLIAGTATDYARDWRRVFAPRIHAAAFVAHWAMSPWAVAMALPILQAFPAVLTEGARTAGKVTPICSPSF